MEANSGEEGVGEGGGRRRGVPGDSISVGSPLSAVIRQVCVWCVCVRVTVSTCSSAQSTRVHQQGQDGRLIKARLLLLFPPSTAQAGTWRAGLDGREGRRPERVKERRREGRKGEEKRKEGEGEDGARGVEERGEEEKERI